MANKLKNLSVTSVDLVDQGANPDAHIRLFKRGAEPQEDEPTESEKGLFKKFLHWFSKGYEDAQKGADPEGDVQKDAKMFAETLNREAMRQITSEIFDFCYALSDSLSSIICDKDLTADSKQAMMSQSLKEFGETMDNAVAAWAKGNRAKAALEEASKEAGIQKSAAQQTALETILQKRGLTENGDVVKTNSEKEEYDTMKIDKSKMTPEELAVLEGFEKKYGAASDPEGNEPTPGGVEKGAEGAKGNEPAPDDVTKGATGAEPSAPAAGANTDTLHPDVQKALADMRAEYAKQTAEVEALKKSLEIEKMTAVAKKYEPLGKNSAELAAKMYDLKKAGGTVYDDYMALLDENLAMLGKSRLFGEIGSNRQGSAGSEESIGIKAAELAKSANGGMTHADAVIKAFEENPELAAQYEQEYMGR